MKGYWNDARASAETVRDGWLYTGDLGHLDSEGFLTITGRKKELLVLSTGQKVVPSRVERLLTADPYIDQAMVYGEGRSYLTALIVPHWENVRRGLSAEGIPVDGESTEILAQHQAVRHLLQRRVGAALADVAAWECVNKFLILPRPFSIADEELTVSLKLRRSVVLARYQAELDLLYRQ